MSSRERGQQGEKMAVDYLTARGYRIVERNYYTRRGEIDIIGWDKGREELVFIEVKTRGSLKYGWGEESIDEQKFNKIMMAAEDYMGRTGYQGNYRFDCLAIEMNYAIKKSKVNHLENIGF